MKSLLSNYLLSVTNGWHDFLSDIKNLASGEYFPAEIEGVSGTGASFLTAHYIEAVRARILSALQYNATGRYSQGQQSAGVSSLSASSLDFVVVVPTEKEALDLTQDFETAFSDSVEVYSLPWWGIVPYRSVAVGSAVFGQRSGVLSRLAYQARSLNSNTKPRIFLITQRSLQTPLPSPEYIRSLVFNLHKGLSIDPTDLAEKLASLGYIRVPKVGVPGEFTLRGEVLDVFTPGEARPSRILFDFDEISSIKSFDVETQSTVEVLDSLLIYPMKEVIWNDELLGRLESVFEKFGENLAKNDLDNPLSADSVASVRNSADKETIFLALTEEAEKAKLKLLDELRAGRESEGEELFYGAVWEKKYTLFDYISSDTTVFFYDYDRLNNMQENYDREYAGMYRTARQKFPVLPPSEMILPFEKVSEMTEHRISFRTLHTETDEEENANEDVNFFKIECEPPKSFFGNINYLKEQLEDLQSEGWKIFVFADNENQSLRIKEILKNYIDKPAEGEYLERLTKNAKRGIPYYPLVVYPKAITTGFGISETKTLVIQENEIFGRRKHVPKSIRSAKSQTIDTFVELNEGDFVVHVNYGIGIFRGIQRVKAMGNERDYIKLEYADEEFAFVPIEQVNLVQRYIGNEGDNPRLDRIGSKSWENRKNKAKKAVEDLAEKLIALYSRRKASRGFPFPKDGEWQTAFEAAFPYEDTPDQFTVSKEIKADMEKPVPMDRLVCGDVGYGKTEIAMRAAFKAVMGGKQVAFLAPTTILAEQHYESCVERFSNFPVTIAQLSRFVSPAEQKKIIAKVAAGEVDILVGTHRIIQKDIVFKDLGLMIIDEEQRFGVKDKEKLKTMKANIDSLAMSATPIPRTLHMSLLKIRDMSLLTTPPQTRKPIETIVDAYTEERVAKAIRQEVERGGQVFYLHNRVETLEDVRRKLQQIVPEMMIDVAHGQMSAEELDDIFRRFKMGGFHILIATTIIENGIDIPNVNTIIIDRADMYGVSQLYQLRGRVGRSDRKAYAYLLYPENKVLSEVAMKRLQVISDFTELGSGFKIAMKDMEIRGAGNLLGRDQSGEVYSVGFDLYVKLLNEAVERLMNNENYEAQNEVLMELEYSGFIPDTYIPNLQTKMEVYKKIAGVQTKSELEGIYLELEDRFGPIPDEVYSLLSLAEVRVIAKKLFISSIKERQGLIQIEFGKVSNIKVDRVLKLIKETAGKVKLDPTKPNMILMQAGKIGLKEKSEFIREKLEALV
ncbi:MAG: transcription-repair coupling factor [Treponema sp.]|uniref:transcription-repair coupling factor n=1 Tax=Treponema sp. TaxID=166 RepID=UPI0025F95C15|nr:transcription-repair coupling factor [Treponema sp.]MBR0496126.1 transcription-repair coupling factor [Treponema sp.]